jgi:hypothetical protein
LREARADEGVKIQDLLARSGGVRSGAESRGAMEGYASGWTMRPESEASGRHRGGICAGRGSGSYDGGDWAEELSREGPKQQKDRRNTTVLVGGWVVLITQGLYRHLHLVDGFGQMGRLAPHGLVLFGSRGVVKPVMEREFARKV